jgi:hypothetical protein
VIEHYKAHIIVGSADREKSTGKYIPVASVGWSSAEGTQQLHAISSSSRYDTEEDAINAALLQARRFIEERLKT